MRIYFAGAKPKTKAHPWDNPQVAVGRPLNVMTTFFELGKMSKKKQDKFLKQLERNILKREHRKLKHRKEGT